ncbi:MULTISPECIES: AfsR/SARP family transcriptional regulator [unclassified Streptomyces]|uniref:AfsR/SARP family transcriptional regulator n=1 Tax=unclassified Streptomyces TaxID=2593676 RepID=UPI0022B6DBF0|nr:MULTISPECIES: AfsR/SARP family transcriptional regulator [unclassified Streptomyces]MCZ7416937.1 BTAD domain-containing putative transcriptional regulator [Streptomyces sp. WMMC897]MCZ7433233.1 BTAD domain-containing putative transcriptional regulator [Streptomyces sp. WMMC1477]
MDIRFRLLGPVQVRIDGRGIPLGGPRQRTVLAALLLNAGQAVPVTRLLELCWSDPPKSAQANLRTYLARLRQILQLPGEAEPRLLTTEHGYALRVGPGELDLADFVEQLTRGSAATDPATACGHLSTALRLWRGDPLDGVAPTVALEAEIAQLVEQRDRAHQRWLRCRLEQGRHAEVLPELRALALEHPLREDVVVLLMRALYRCGRRSDALEVFRATRRRLVEELGVEPDAELQRLYREVLDATADPQAPVTPAAPVAVAPSGSAVTAADVPSAPGPADRAAPGTARASAGAGASAYAVGRPEDPEPVGARRQLPPDIYDFTGRQDELERLHQILKQPSEHAPVVCVLHGMGGVGKTRLAIHAAHRRVRCGHYADGQLYADLRGLNAHQPPAAPAEVLEWFLHQMGIPEERIPLSLPARSALFRDRLAGQRALLVLDNAASEDQLLPLLPSGPGCTVLVTSRRNLSLEGAVSLPVDVFTEADALEFLAANIGRERAAAEPEGARELLRICAGLPIAVALAAHRIRARPAWRITDLLHRLRHPSRMLDELAAGTRSVRAVIGLSYQALNVEQQRMFQVLGTQPGADATAAAAAAASGLPTQTAEELLESLLDEHVLFQTTPGRYRMHPLIHAYARRLADA